MIWSSWRRAAQPPAPPSVQRPFEDLVEEAPLIALLIEDHRIVVAANRAARDYFRFDAARLPAGLVEVTRETAISELLRRGKPEGEVKLVHHNSVVRSRLIPGPESGLTLMFLTDVTEQRRLETVRQEFVANLSHELKTPITSLRLAVESLQADPPEAARRKFLERALKETDHLAAIVDNLRQLAQIEGGDRSTRMTRFALAAVVQETAERLHLERPLEANIPDGCDIVADRPKLAQAIGNLLDNAAKFSPPGSPIGVAAQETGTEVEITVRDHGPGISPEHWDRVFERFYKVDPARSRDLAGSGLGLAITKHLVMAQGGRVWTAAAEGGGQVFGIALPKSGSSGS